MPHPFQEKILSLREFRFHPGVRSMYLITLNLEELANCAHTVESASQPSLAQFITQLDEAQAKHSKLENDIWAADLRTSYDTYDESRRVTSSAQQSLWGLHVTLNLYRQALLKQVEMAKQLQDMLIQHHTAARNTTGDLERALDLCFEMGDTQQHITQQEHDDTTQNQQEDTDVTTGDPSS
jgi:hypothetical protein